VSATISIYVHQKCVYCISSCPLTAAVEIVCMSLHLSISFTELHCTYELDIQYETYKLEVFVISVVASLNIGMVLCSSLLTNTNWKLQGSYPS